MKNNCHNKPLVLFPLSCFGALKATDNEIKMHGEITLYSSIDLCSGEIGEREPT